MHSDWGGGGTLYIFPTLHTLQEERETEDEAVRWHHRFNGHELGQTLGDGEG